MGGPFSRSSFEKDMNNFQSLRQEGERDCAVPVFGKLTGVSREGILRDLPEAAEGKVTPDQWEDWLGNRSFGVTRYNGCNEHYELPCAHLVQRHSPHWVYEDENGVLDPSPCMACMPPHDSRMRDWDKTYGGRILTISVKQRMETL